MEVQSFLGFTEYYRRFIPKFACRWHEPLHKLMSGENAGKKKAAIKWGSSCQQALDDLKKLCTMAPILAYADFTKPFKPPYWCLWHWFGGCPLSNLKRMAPKLVIAYASRSLSKAKSHYPAPKLEFLTLKWAVVKKFHEYLYGLTFDVHTNNNPLTYVLTTANMDAASHCWVTSLANYNFRLHYRAGKANIDADALLRVSWPGCMPDSLGTHLKVTAASSVSWTRSCPQGACKPHGGLQLWSACFGCNSRQQAGHLYDPRGLASSPRSRPCPESSHCWTERWNARERPVQDNRPPPKFSQYR